MELVPKIIINEVSKAENRIFNILNAISGHKNSVVLHSLNCSEHQYKQWSEIDFCLLLPDGIFVLEVKGGRVSCQDGEWEYRGTHRRGTSREGPFQQASSARYALEKLLKKKFNLNRKVRDWPIVFGWGVVLPDTPWSHSSVEMPLDVVADRSTCANPDTFKSYLNNLILYWKKKDSYKNRLPLSKKELQFIRSSLRPDIDFLPPFETGLQKVRGKISKFTDQQYVIVDSVAENKQLIIEGGAGTGKTFTAIQMARIDAESGLDVLFITESPILANFLEKNEVDPKITIMSYDKLIRRFDQNKYDILYIDEGQDLCSFEVFDNLSSKLIGGLDHGSWRWFMDPNKQANLRGIFDPEALQVLRSGFGHLPMSQKLNWNVRNTKQIVDFAEAQTGATVGNAKISDTADDPLILRVTYSELVYTTCSRVDYYQKKDVSLGDIGLVFSSALRSDLKETIISSLGDKAASLSGISINLGLHKKILFGDSARFKGLEKPIIIGVGFTPQIVDTDLINEKYVAVTRANYSVTLIELLE